jgi:hypothetical protein
MSAAARLDCVRLTRIDAAGRLIDAAIEMFFFDGDPIAIHTIAAASHDIVRALAKRRGVTGLSLGANLIEREFHKQWNDLTRSDTNPLKPVDGDPNDDVEVDPELTEALLMFALRGLRRMGHTCNGLQAAYWTWFCLHHPAATTIDMYSLKLPPETVAALRAMPKGDFVRKFQEAHRLERIVKSKA